MTTFERILTLLGVLLFSGLAAMLTMTLHRAGAFGLFWPWAWFGWAKAYAHIHPLLYLGDLGLGLVVFVLPTWITIMILKVTTPKAKVQTFGKEAWARKRDVEKKAKLIHRDGNFSGRIIGKFSGKLLVFKGEEPVLVVGATRSGKGAGNVVPSLIAYPESAFIYDRKAELWHITVDRRKTFSHCVKFDPTDPHTIRWNPLFEIRMGLREIADLQNCIMLLVDPSGKKAGDFTFWDESAINFFTALILHILYTAPDDKKNMGEVRRQLINIGPTLHAMQNTMHRYKPDMFAGDGFARDENGEQIPEAHPEIVLGATAFAQMEDRVKGSVVATMQSALRLWADPLVQYATSTSDITIGDLVCSEYPVSFYFQSPQAHANRIAVLVRMFMQNTINGLMEHAHLDGRERPKKHRLLLMLDEFPKLGTLSFLEDALGEMTGFGLTAHLVCQSFSDIKRKYGPHNSIFGNIRVTTVGTTPDPDNAAEVIKRAGKWRELRQSFSDPRGWMGSKSHRSTSRSEQEEYILSEDDVRTLDEKEQFVFYSGVKPIRAKKIRYWEERVLAPHCGGWFNKIPAKYVQKRGGFDLPGQPQIDWLGVSAIKAAPPAPPSAQAVTEAVQQAAAEAEKTGAFLPQQTETDEGDVTYPSDVDDSAMSDAVHGQAFDYDTDD